MMHLVVNFVGIILFGIHSAPWVFGFLPFNIWEVFRHCFLKSLSDLICFPLLQRLSHECSLSLFSGPWDTPFPPFCSDGIKSIALSWIFQILFSSISPLLALSFCNCCFSYCVFQYYNFHCHFLFLLSLLKRSIMLRVFGITFELFLWSAL